MGIRVSLLVHLHVHRLLRSIPSAEKPPFLLTCFEIIRSIDFVYEHLHFGRGWTYNGQSLS